MEYSESRKFEELIYASYPLFSYLSREQINAVDMNVLWVPSNDDHALIDALGAMLDKHVVIYNPTCEPKKGHLCRMIKAAVLESNQIKEVQAVEQKLGDKDKVLVVYEKPIMLNPHFNAVE